ncbi:MAG: hypothetical protein QHH12_08145 [Candidatus Bathyarchaeota archaeon]|nr:hypothetical protein [Candidatus Bathyarchaeota archaeon]
MFDRKQKILVEIYDKTGLKKVKKCPIESDHVIIRSPRRGPGGSAYKARFNEDCIIYYTAGLWPFKRLKRKLLLKDGATECINLHADPIELPTWDRATEEKLFEANVIKAAGATVHRIQIPALLYFLVFMGVVMQFITLLIVTGKVKFV